jgi:hypothetical protein
MELFVKGAPEDTGVSMGVLQPSPPYCPHSLAEVAGVSTADEEAGISTADEITGVSAVEDAGVSTAEDAGVSTAEDAGVSTMLVAGAVDDSMAIVEDKTSLEVAGTSGGVGGEGGVYGVSALQSKPMLWKPISQASLSPL